MYTHGDMKNMSLKLDRPKPPLIFKNETPGSKRVTDIDNPGRVKMQVQPLDFFNDWILIDDTYTDLMDLKVCVLAQQQ